VPAGWGRNAAIDTISAVVARAMTPEGEVVAKAREQRRTEERRWNFVNQLAEAEAWFRRKARLGWSVQNKHGAGCVRQRYAAAGAAAVTDGFSK
jgi:hypothetical protein